MIIRTRGGVIANSGWHFLPTDGKLANGDGRPVVAGKWLTHDGPIVPCLSGLHWSPRALDALGYARGPVACRIEAGGETVAHGSPIDKCASERRRVLWMLSVTDGERVLRTFARQCAADVLPMWGRPVPAVVVRWLATGDDDLRAAAWEAAWAARDAAWAVAWAARDAAWEAAWATARVARDTARAAQNARLEAWLTAAHEGRWDDIVVTIPDGVEVKP